MNKLVDENQKHLDEIEIWTERQATAPERMGELARREGDWVEKNREKNLECLKLMRSYVPSAVEGVGKGKDNPLATVKSYISAVGKKGGFATFQLANRLREKKLLQWLVTHPDDIARENFLVGANVQSFKNLQEYDIVELRAVYACLPTCFELDSTPGRVGEKAEWKIGLVNRLKGYVGQQDGDTVSTGWDPVKKIEKFEMLQKLSPDVERNSAYYYPSLSYMEEKLAHFEGLEGKLGGMKKRLKELEGEDGKGGVLAELKEEKDAALADSRSQYLQQEYGKEVLKKLKMETEAAYKKVVDEVGVLKTTNNNNNNNNNNNKVSGKGLKMNIHQLEQNILNASPSKAECLEEFSKVRAQSLMVASKEEDAAVLVGVLEKAYGECLETYCGFTLEGRGKLIEGVMDCVPTLKKKERTAFKKLSDEEEARNRKLEIAAAMKMRDANNAEKEKEEKGGGGGGSGGGGGDGDGDGGGKKNFFQEQIAANNSQKNRTQMKAFLEQQTGGGG